MSNTIALTKATVADLRAYATINHGIDLPDDATKAAITAQILAVEPDCKEIHAGRAEAVPEAPKPVAKTTSGFDRHDSGDKVEVMIPRQEHEVGGMEPVRVSVNGSLMLIPRGQWCAVPRAYAEVLDNAIRTDYLTDQNGAITGSQEIPRFSHQVRELPGRAA